MTKTCRICQKSLPISEFYANRLVKDGYLNRCKWCVLAWQKRHRDAHRPERAEYERQRFQDPQRKQKVLRYQRKRRAAHPDKDRARQAVRRAVQSGRLVKQPCQVCGNTRAQAHHEDYSRPLDVMWLCFRHHRERHGQVVLAA